jgi:hypothetical protein
MIVYVDSGGSNLFYMKKNITDEEPQSEFIVTNDSSRFKKIDNILDTRIFKWLIDSKYSIFKDKMDVVDRSSLLKFFKESENLIKSNPAVVKDAIKYTKTYKIINLNHHFQYNKNEILKIKEKIHQDRVLKDKISNFDVDYETENLEELNVINKGIHYDFFNPVGKIMGKGFNLTKFDRKKYSNLFKNDNEKYYLVDFKSFEPTMLNYYLPGYIHDNFYEENSAKLGMEREIFKENYNAWINGAGKSKLGDLNEKFPEMLPEIQELRRQITPSFKNYFGRTIVCGEKYKRLGYLIQSTAGDLIKELHNKIYEKERGFKIIYSLADEFFLKGNVDEFIKLINLSYPDLRVKVEEV